MSDTAAACNAHLVEVKLAEESGLVGAVRAALRDLEGAYAIVVLSMDEPDVMVGAKLSSPLVVGIGDGENLLASDIPAVLSRTRKVVPIEEGQIVEVRADRVVVTDFEGAAVETHPMDIDWDVSRAQKGGYDDFMLKEIHEQPSAI